MGFGYECPGWFDLDAVKEIDNIYEIVSAVIYINHAYDFFIILMDHTHFMYIILDDVLVRDIEHRVGI